MNEDIQNRLVASLDKVLTWTEQAAHSAGQFASEQIPQVVTEIVQWEFWNATISASIAGIWVLTYLFVAICYTRSLWKKAYDGIDDSDGESVTAFCGVYVAVSLLTLFIFSESFLPNFKWAVKCVVAPRLVVIEVLRQLTTGK